MKTTSIVGTIAVAAMATTGCAATTVTPNTPVNESARTANATLVVGEITHPRDLTTAQPFYVAMQREAGSQLTHSHVANEIVAERDLGAVGVRGKAFALRYRVVDDHVVSKNTGVGCRVALTMTGSLLLVPVFFLGMCTQSAEHRLSVEARVYDLEGAPITKVRDENSNEMLNVYDTSSLTPLLRKEYPVSVVVTRSVFSDPSGDELIEDERKEAAEAMRQILAGSLSDVSHAVALH